MRFRKVLFLQASLSYRFDNQGTIFAERRYRDARKWLATVADVTKLLPTQMPGGLPRREQLLPWLVNALLLTVVVIGSAAGSQFRFRFPDIPESWLTPEEFDINVEQPEPLPEPPLRPEDFGELPRWLGPLLIALLISGIGYLVFRYFWRRRGALRHPPPEIDNEPDVVPTAVQFNLAELQDAVAVALARMAAARNPGDAIVAGWLAFEDAAGAKGWVREPQETTTEFTDRLLRGSPAPPEPIATLRELYQQVRFGGRKPTDLDVRTAQQALGEIAAYLDDIPGSESSADELSVSASPAETTREKVGSSGIYPVTPAPNPSKVTAGVSRNKWGED